MKRLIAIFALCCALPLSAQWTIGQIGNILPSGTMTINSSYTIDGHVNYAASINYGTAVAHLVQSPNGSLTNPTWSETGSPLALACSLASFH